MVKTKNFTAKKFHSLAHKFSVVKIPNKTRKISIHYIAPNFKNDELYKKNIERLLNSTNIYHRMYAYNIVGIIGDKKYANLLLKVIKSREFDSSTFWAGMNLLILQSTLDVAEPLFNLIINKKNEASHILFPLYSQLLDKKKLYNIALKHFNSKEIKTQIYTVRLCAVLQKDKIIENYLKSIVKTKPVPLKGYAISCLGHLNIGDLLELLTPSLKEKELRQYVLIAFANSPTKKDRNFIYNLIKNNKTLDKEILNALLKSHRKDNIKIWFSLLKDGEKIPKDYYFSIYYHKLIHSDSSLLSEFHNVIASSQDKDYLKYLIGGLRERNDKKSIQIVRKHLKHPNKSVSYWAKQILKSKSKKQATHK